MQNLISGMPSDGGAVWEAHKIREYLTVILGSLEQLQHQSLDDRGHKQLRRAEVAAQQLAKMMQLGATEET